MGKNYYNRPNKSLLYNTEKERVQNDYVNDLLERQIVNEDKYNVEVAKDVSINEIPRNLVEEHQEITGYTAGLITRDLVTMGEEMIKNKNKNK